MLSEVSWESLCVGDIVIFVNGTLGKIMELIPLENETIIVGRDNVIVIEWNSGGFSRVEHLECNIITYDILSTLTARNTQP